MGRDGAAREVMLRAAGLARRLHSPARLARAALGAGATIMSATEIPSPDPLVTGLQEEALAELDDDPRVRCRLLIALCRSGRRFDGEQHESERRLVRRAEDALALAKQIGDLRLVAEATWNKVLVEWVMGREDRLDDVAGELQAFSRELRDSEIELWGRTCSVLSQMVRSDPAVFQSIDGFARLADGLANPAYQWYGTHWQAFAALVRGDLDTAEQLAKEALALGQELQRAGALPAFFGMYAAIRNEQDSLEEIAAIGRSMIDANMAHPVALAIAAGWYGTLGWPDEARAVLQRIRSYLCDPEPELESVVAWCSASLACAVADDAGLAAVLLERLKPHADLYCQVPPGMVPARPVAFYLGLLARTCRMWQEASQYFSRSVTTSMALGARASTAEAQVEWARSLLQADPPDIDRAEQLLDASARNAASVGQRRVLRLGQEVHAINPNRSAAGQLTRREVDVVMLVGQGLKNQQIADRLHLSTRTVEAHVLRVREKLAMATRAELAAWTVQNLSSRETRTNGSAQSGANSAG